MALDNNKKIAKNTCFYIFFGRSLFADLPAIRCNGRG